MAIGLRPFAAGLRIASGLVFAVCAAREIYIKALGSPRPLGDLPLLDFDREMTLPSWYSGMLMGVCAGLLLAHSAISRSLGERHVGHFIVLAVAFLYLSFDEIVAIHERAIQIFGRIRAYGGYFRMSWVLVAIPAVAVFAIAFSRFLVRLPSPFGRRILVSGIVFVMGAIGMEMVAGHILGWRSPVAYRVAVITEEGLEIGGLTMFATALVEYLAARTSGIAITLDGR